MRLKLFFLNLIFEFFLKTWFNTNWKKFNESDLTKKPVFLSKDIYYEQNKLDREMMYLINKAKYYVPKPKPKPKANATESKFILFALFIVFLLLFVFVLPLFMFRVSRVFSDLLTVL